LTEEKIKELVLESLEANEFSDCYLYSIKIGGNKVSVYLESDESITYLKCRKVSRHVEAYLDEIEWCDGKYTIDVSSPGIGAPLKFERQYPKNVGRTIEVKYGEGQKVKGLLTKVEDGVIDVSYKERIKEGKKKRTVEIVDSIKIEDITEAKIKVTF
jgi:ribosome maturation factor RimP